MIDSVTETTITRVLNVHVDNKSQLGFTNTTNGTASWFVFGGHLDFSMWLVPHTGFRCEAHCRVVEYSTEYRNPVQRHPPHDSNEWRLDVGTA